MSFISMGLLLLVAVAAIIYYIIPKKYQWIVLLLVSYGFYASYGIKTMVFIVFTTVTTYFGGLFIAKTADFGKEKLANENNKKDPETKKYIKKQIKRKKQSIVFLILLLNFGILALLKYFNFAAESISSILQGFGLADMLLPLGISFYTFQSAGYIIDIYRGKHSAEKNPFKYALFISFFPQLLQGPIGRFDKLAKQFFDAHVFNIVFLEHAVQRILWGFFKKFVLADRAAVFVNTVFGNYTEYHGIHIIAGILLFSVQLYADFSGGIDVVIGIAEVFGIKLEENFARPFASRSISEFWRRWHITLGAWMKDYVFYPFSLSKAMNRFGKFSKKLFGNHIGRTLPVCIANLLIFFLVGIWHGASRKYVAYGLYNGFIIAFSSMMEPVYQSCLNKLHIRAQAKPYQFFRIIRTFILVNIGWYFDVAESFSAALVIFKNTVTDFSLKPLTDGSLYGFGLRMRDFLILFAGCLVWFVVSYLQEHKINIRESLGQKPVIVRWAAYITLIFAPPVLGFISVNAGFIYAQF